VSVFAQLRKAAGLVDAAALGFSDLRTAILIAVDAARQLSLLQQASGRAGRQIPGSTNSASRSASPIGAGERTTLKARIVRRVLLRSMPAARWARGNSIVGSQQRFAVLFPNREVATGRSSSNFFLSSRNSIVSSYGQLATKVAKSRESIDDRSGVIIG